MKVLYDGFIFRAQRVGGISRYFQDLVAHLPGDLEPHVTVQPPPGRIFPQHPRLTTHCVPAWVRHVPRGRRALSRACLRGFEWMAGCDVLHPTFYETLLGRPAGAFGRRRRKVPMVLTVFDMIDEIFHTDLDPAGEMAGMKRSAIESADAILCISESTRHDLQARHRIPDARIVVTPLATALAPAGPGACGEVPAGPYVLFIGGRDGYKNFVRVLLALAAARRGWADLSLAVCGAPFNDTERGLVRALELCEAVRHLGCVPDEHLAKLYGRAEALLYPSLYEGFGIPPLEAMVCGTVVITSTRSSLPEVVGDAALFVDPESVGEISEAMLRLRELGAHRATLIQAGRVRAARFSWARTAQVTAGVYRALAA